MCVSVALMQQNRNAKLKAMTQKFWSRTTARIRTRGGGLCPCGWLRYLSAPSGCRPTSSGLEITTRSTRGTTTRPVKSPYTKNPLRQPYAWISSALTKGMMTPERDTPVAAMPRAVLRRRSNQLVTSLDVASCPMLDAPNPINSPITR